MRSRQSLIVEIRVYRHLIVMLLLVVVIVAMVMHTQDYGKSDGCGSAKTEYAEN